MAFKAQQLRALNTIVGVLKNGREITAGTYFECGDAETEEFLLRTRSAEVAELPSAPEVMKDAPARGRPPKTDAAKPAPKPASKAADKGTDKDLV